MCALFIKIKHYPSIYWNQPYLRTWWSSCLEIINCLILMNSEIHSAIIFLHHVIDSSPLDCLFFLFISLYKFSCHILIDNLQIISLWLNCHPVYFIVNKQQTKMFLYLEHGMLHPSQLKIKLFWFLLVYFWSLNQHILKSESNDFLFKSLNHA